MSQSSLSKATAEKIYLYKQCFSTDTKVVFWDIVVLTAGNEAQRRSFEQQVELKKQRNEIPAAVKYLVYCDPPGAKIGAGGATMYVLQQMEREIGWENMQTARILLVHAGGYSQRLANVSTVGKVFMALPCGEPAFYQMLDALLIMYCDLPARMSPGVFLASSDVLFLYNGEGHWSMSEAGVTAIAHPASMDLCTNHGVFVFKDVNELWKKYKDDPSKPACMAPVQRFLHKCTQQRIEECGAVITNQKQIYVDLAYWFDFNTVKKMIKFYTDNEPLDCEIDAYGDFLQALGPDATPDYCERTGHVSTATSSLVETRKRIFQLFRDTPFRAVVFNEAQFNHVGTTKEYLHHFCYNETLIESFSFKREKAVRYLSQVASEGPAEKKPRTDKLENCAVICSHLSDTESVVIGPGSVVEYSVLSQGVRVGSQCIVSGLYIPAHSTVPDSSFLHTLPVTIDERTCYATFAFDISDSMKTSTETPSELPYCKVTIGEALKRLFPERTELDVWPTGTDKHTLWTARLFPAFPSRQLSSQYAIDMITCLRDTTHTMKVRADGMRIMSVYDMVQSKSLEAMLSYCNGLQDKH